MSENGWQLRYAPGEPGSRVASGEWTGKTIADYAGDAVSLDPAAPVIAANERWWTSGHLKEEALRLWRGLCALGIRPGDTVSFQLPNWIEVAVIDLACAIGGFVLNPIIPIYRHAELRFILNDAKAKIAFIPQIYRGVDYPQMYAALRTQLPAMETIVVRGEAEGASTYESVMAAGARSTREPEPVDPNGIKQVIYTSGTTGAAKGVLYTHNQARRVLANSMDAWGLKPGARLLIGTPVTHVSGFSYGIDMPFYVGTQTVLMERWSADEAVELIERHAVNVMLGATPFLAELLASAEKLGSSLPSLEIFFCGGAAVPPALVRRAHEVFENCRTFRVFGSSECPMITQGCPEDRDLSATTDGRIFGYEVKVVDDHGNILPPDTDGEMLARGAAMFRGYTDPEATRQSFDAEGFFRTGDIGRVTADGVLTVTGRKKDLIIRGGENISAKEIEDALHTHPDIKEAAIVAMPHARLGEGVCAVVIPKGSYRPVREEISAYLKRWGLAPQKWPELIHYVDDLPRTASGKVQKHLLRQQIADLVRGHGAPASS
jgi:acyl-CoA synthetase (AMP-forming)/AMP-acid ligase II